MTEWDAYAYGYRILAKQLEAEIARRLLAREPVVGVEWSPPNLDADTLTYRLRARVLP